MKIQVLLTTITLAGFALVGCSEKDIQVTAPEDSSAPIVMDELPPMFEASGHPEHGPHGGELVELGNEAFHIEMIHVKDAAAFYVLDGAAKNAVAIAADELTVSLKKDGEVRSFKLPADAQADDESGKSSRFASVDKELAKWLETGAEGVIVVNIDSKSFTGNISHDHDHEGHDHESDDHEGHDHAH